ncbi:MAG: hypothetical protein P8X74_21685 [Reinekea sp.]
MQNILISTINSWFRDKTDVYMMICGSWLGKPKDDWYSLVDVYFNENDLHVKLSEDWSLLLTGNISAREKNNTISLVCDSLILQFPSGKIRKYTDNVEVDFFVD